MDTDQFLMELLKVVSGNTGVISELRRAVENLPDRAEFQVCKDLAKDTGKVVEDTKALVEKIDGRLDGIDKWQRVRMPLIVGTITLLIYAVGFFFTINKVSDMIEGKHTPAPITQPARP